MVLGEKERTDQPLFAKYDQSYSMTWGTETAQSGRAEADETVRTC